MITREQAKAARKLLGWSQMTLSIEADVSIPTLVGFERGQKLTRKTIVLKIQRTFERAGIIFLDSGPVRAPYQAAAEWMAVETIN
jgi:DNA-binding XRE family transcriptional regulator